MKEKAILVFDSRGLEAIIKFLKEQQPITEAANAFNDVMRHAYWKKQDLDSTVALAQAGISFSAEEAKTSSKEDQDSLLSNVMQISYNLASFTWPGWDEEWMGTIPANYLKLGHEAAKTNLHYAIELNKGDLSISRGHWIVAAHQLATGEFHLAEESFELAVKFAVKANEKGDELLSKGFIQVARLLAKPKSMDAHERMEQTKITLNELEHGEFYIKQLEDSLRIFA